MIDERTGLEIIDEAECRELLASKEIGRIAVSIANKPDVYPVNYKTTGNRIVIHTIPGTKLAAAVLGTAVAFEVDDLDEVSKTGWSVVVHGHASEVEGTEAIMEAEALGIHPWSDNPKLRYLQIEIDEISGRRLA